MGACPPGPRRGLQSWGPLLLTGIILSLPLLFPRCVRRPRPRDSRQRPRAAGKEARQAVCKAVSSCLYPAQGQCWSLAGLSSQGCQVFRGVGSLACR